MPLTIVGSKFYEIYEDVEIEDYMMREEMKKIFKPKETKKEEPGTRLSLSLALNLKFMNKMKKYSAAAKIRVREMSLDPNEIERAFEYMDAVDGVSLLFAVCCLRSCTLVSVCRPVSKTNWETDRN